MLTQFLLLLEIKELPELKKKRVNIFKSRQCGDILRCSLVTKYLPQSRRILSRRNQELNKVYVSLICWVLRFYGLSNF